MLHIEITGDCSPKEWGALRVLADYMLDGAAPAVTVGGIMPELAAAKTVDVASLPPIPTATPVATPGAAMADALMAAEEARVAGVHAGTEELPSIVPPPGVAVDARGFPHDLRIHAATASLKKDNTWTYKRGVDAALIAAVEAELRAVMAAPVPPAAEGPAVTDAAAAFGAVPPPPAGATVPEPPAAPVADSPPAAATPPVADNMGEFARIMRVVVDKQKAGTVTSAVVDEIAKSLGIGSVRDLAKRPDLVPAFEALLP